MSFKLTFVEFFKQTSSKNIIFLLLKNFRTSLLCTVGQENSKVAKSQKYGCCAENKN
jgi:hypothetical protein